MINKVILIGNLGKGPEMRNTQAGKAVASFNIATTERRKAKDGSAENVTEWHSIVVWDKLAELCGQYLHKGSKVYIEGKLQTRKWQDKEGQDRYTTEVVAQNIQFLTPKGGEGGSGAYQSNVVESQPSFEADIPF